MKLLFKNSTGQLTLFVNKHPEPGYWVFTLLGIIEIVAIAGLLFLMWSLAIHDQKLGISNAIDKEISLNSALSMSSSVRTASGAIICVHDLEDHPIPGAIVIVKDPPQIIGNTDEQGYLHLQLSADVTHITITASGYITQTFLLPDFRKSDSMPVTYQLKPNPMLISLNAHH